MKSRLTVLLTMVVLLQGCAFLQRQTGPSKAEGFGESKASDLVISAVQDTVFAEWGKTTEAIVDVAWAAEQKYAVQLAPAAGTPRWLGVELQPAIVDPPGRIAVKLSPIVGEAKLGDYKLVLEGSAFGITQTVKATILVIVQRQSGEFAPLLAAPTTVECRNICGSLHQGTLAFYDVLREKNQTCDDRTPLPESQRIGGNSFYISEKGFGYGRTCRVAGVYEASGVLTFVNLGIYSAVPRGAMMLSLRSVKNCWLSVDNTVALMEFPGVIQPYDVLTGVPLANPCRTSAGIANAALTGNTLTSGSCTWEIR